MQDSNASNGNVDFGIPTSVILVWWGSIPVWFLHKHFSSFRYRTNRPNSSVVRHLTNFLRKTERYTHARPRCKVQTAGDADGTVERDTPCISVAHPDPGIYASDKWKRILLFSSLTFKMPRKI
jgi:hypothetical protein